jgi:succinate dehydrogenase / fumarate reductase, membrane anchor subunit
MREKRGSTESKSWLFMRGSGFLMPSLVIGHLVIQHLVNDVHDLRVEWVAERWNKTGWRAWDGLMLILAVGHGLNGTRYVIDDYVHDPAVNQAAKLGVTMLGVVLVAVGLLGIVAFDKETTLQRLED